MWDGAKKDLWIVQHPKFKYKKMIISDSFHNLEKQNQLINVTWSSHQIYWGFRFSSARRKLCLYLIYIFRWTGEAAKSAFLVWYSQEYPSVTGRNSAACCASTPSLFGIYYEDKTYKPNPHHSLVTHWAAFFSGNNLEFFHSNWFIEMYICYITEVFKSPQFRDHVS